MQTVVCPAWKKKFNRIRKKFHSGLFLKIKFNFCNKDLHGKLCRKSYDSLIKEINL